MLINVEAISYKFKVNEPEVIHIAQKAIQFYLDVLCKNRLTSFPGVDSYNETNVANVLNNLIFPGQQEVAEGVRDKLNKASVEGGVYEINLLGEEAQLLSMACELLARVSMGQMDLANHLSLVDSAELYRQVESGRFRSEEGYVISRHALQMDNREAMDTAFYIHQVIRYRLSWDRVGNPEKRDWSTMFGVNFDEPISLRGSKCSFVRE